MEEKTLGEIAPQKAREVPSLPNDTAWQAVADAVVAEYEARRWKAWPPPTDGEEPTIVALDDPDGERLLAFRSEDYHSGEPRWHDEGGESITDHEPPRHWTPIPAPPKESEHAD